MMPALGLYTAGVTPIYEEESIVDRHLGKIRYYTKKQRITKKDRETNLPNFLAANRKTLEDVIVGIGQFNHQPETLDGIVKLIGDKYAWPVKKIETQREVLRATFTAIRTMFPKGIPDELKTSILEQFATGQGLTFSRDGLHATLSLQWDENFEPITLKLRKDPLGLTWEIDL